MSVAMFVRMAVAGKSPNQKTDARDHQHPADNVTLLGFDLFLELETDEGYQPS